MFGWQSHEWVLSESVSHDSGFHGPQNPTLEETGLVEAVLAHGKGLELDDL